MKWKKSGTAREWIEWAFDKAGNREYRWNRTPSASGKKQDEYCEYDRLYRLKKAERGILNAVKTGIVSPATHGETWSYDLMGNWTNWKERDHTGSTVRD